MPLEIYHLFLTAIKIFKLPSLPSKFSNYPHCYRKKFGLLSLPFLSTWICCFISQTSAVGPVQRSTGSQVDFSICCLSAYIVVWPSWEGSQAPKSKKTMEASTSATAPDTWAGGRSSLGCLFPSSKHHSWALRRRRRNILVSATLPSSS